MSGQHSHDRMRLSIDDNPLTDDVRRACEALLPEAVADDRHARCGERLVRTLKVASDDRPDPEGRQDVSRCCPQAGARARHLPQQ